MPGARRRGRPSFDPGELPDLSPPVTIGEFDALYRNDLLGLPGGPSFFYPPKTQEEPSPEPVPIPDPDLRERRLLVARLARSLLRAGRGGEGYQLEGEGRSGLLDASDAFASVLAAYHSYFHGRDRSPEAVLLSSDAAARVRIPAYLACEAAATFVLRAGGHPEGAERLDVPIAYWFSMDDQAGTATRNRESWSRLLHHAAALLRIARQYDPNFEIDEHEIVRASDVLERLQEHSDGAGAAVADIAALMQGTIRQDPRAAGRQKGEGLSRKALGVEAYLWRQCGVETEDIARLLGLDGSERSARQVARVVSAAKEALLRPGEPLRHAWQEKRRRAARKPIERSS